MEEINVYSTAFIKQAIFHPLVLKIQFDSPRLSNSNQSLMFYNPQIEVGKEFKRIVEVVNMKAVAQLTSITRKTIGEMTIKPFMFSQQPHDSWEWRVDVQDISEVEQHRTGGDFSFNLLIEGAIIVVDDLDQERTIPVRGEKTLRIPKSDWIDIIEKLGYQTSYTIDLPETILRHSSWNSASKQLEKARHLLNQGYTHRSLEECLAVFEAFIDKSERGSGPYNKNLWNGLVQQFSDQKQEGVKVMLAGICTYLNKVGHHLDTGQRNEAGLSTPVQIDQYEAEIMLSMCQMAITYIERIRESAKFQ